MGHIYQPHQPKRLKPSLQQLLYHTKQPVLTLLAGSVIALAINFSLAQVHLSSNTDNTSASTSNPAVLEAFDIKTNPESKEVNIILHRQADKSSNERLAIHTAKKGNQYTLTIENTQLSQQMVDSGLPVVIDNQNKLIGRAVPGKTVNQSKIIIPNLPSQDDYQVLVYEQVANQEPRLLSGNGSSQTLASHQMATPVIKQQAQKPSYHSTAYDVPAISTRNEATSKKPSPRIEKMAATTAPAIHVAETPKSTASKAAPTMYMARQKEESPKPRTEKVAMASSKPKPRSAVPFLEGRFESIADSVKIQSAPLASLPQNQESFALASIAKNPAPSQPKTKRPIQVVENKMVSGNEVTIRPKNLAPLSNTISTENASAASPQAVNNGSITYVPSFGKSSRSGFQHGPLWNPYVVREQAQEPQTSSNQSQPSNENVALSQIPPLQTTTISGSNPSPDPLWYLHNLPSPGSNPNISLQPVPDLSNGLPITSNPTLSEANSTTNPTLASGNIQIDTRFIKTLKNTLLNLPIWFYIIFGLFFGGIGLFATLGAVFILQQLWLNTRKPTIIQVAPAEAKSAASTEVPKQTEESFNTEAIQFKDSTNTELRHYLEQNRAWDQQQHVKNAVKKSVLLHFPSQRAGNKSRTSTRKASNLLL